MKWYNTDCTYQLIFRYQLIYVDLVPSLLQDRLVSRYLRCEASPACFVVKCGVEQFIFFSLMARLSLEGTLAQSRANNIKKHNRV